MNGSDWVGSIGVGMLLVAFALNLSGRLTVRSMPYKLLNLCGAGLACSASVMIDYVPFVVLEGVWAGVALFALFRPAEASA